MRSITALLRDHCEILERAEILRGIVGRSSPPEPHLLFTIRREFSRVLLSHLAAEDWTVYPRLVASADPLIAARACELRREHGDLACDFKAYGLQWTATTIAADWAGFGVATLAMLDRLAERVKREEGELYTLLDDGGRAAA